MRSVIPQLVTVVTEILFFSPLCFCNNKAKQKKLSSCSKKRENNIKPKANIHHSSHTDFISTFLCTVWLFLSAERDNYRLYSCASEHSVQRETASTVFTASV